MQIYAQYMSFHIKRDEATFSNYLKSSCWQILFKTGKLGHRYWLMNISHAHTMLIFCVVCCCSKCADLTFAKMS